MHMANIGPRANSDIRRKVIKLCWDYLHDNFHKLNEANKIKVALAISCKNIPTELEGSLDLKIQSVNYGDLPPV